jgi:hypothetical protein
MRLALLALCLAGPAHAWEFTPGLPCILSHDAPGARIVLTFDPTAPLYTVTVTGEAPWPGAPVFSMRFDGPRGLTISTTRHVLSEDGRALTVTDTGFANVLDGLEFNDSATAFSGGVETRLSLDGAAEPVRLFRACAGSPSV